MTPIEIILLGIVILAFTGFGITLAAAAAYERSGAARKGTTAQSAPAEPARLRRAA